MKFIALKTDDGIVTGKISFYCKALNVSRQGFYKYLISKDKSCKYEPPANAILDYRPFCGKIEKTFMRICVAHANEWG